VAVGLLKRKNWARMAFVGLVGMGIVWNVASIILVYYFLPSMSEVINDEPAALQAQFNIMRNIAAVLGFAMFSGFFGLFGWILGRIISDDIRREFT
jgi:Kef-type K+ transport system membrane component KefB